MLKELMLEEERKGKESHRNLLRIVYASLLFIIFLGPYCLKDRLSGPWFTWSILGACILTLLITFARCFYYVFKEYKGSDTI